MNGRTQQPGLAGGVPAGSTVVLDPPLASGTFA